jgi:hypothetical protein
LHSFWVFERKLERTDLYSSFEFEFEFEFEFVITLISRLRFNRLKLCGPLERGFADPRAFDVRGKTDLNQCRNGVRRKRAFTTLEK